MAPRGCGSLIVLVAAVLAAEIFKVTADEKGEEDAPVSSTIPVPIPLRRVYVSPEILKVTADGKGEEDLPVSSTIPVPIPLRRQYDSPEILKVTVDGKGEDDLPVSSTIPVPIPVRHQNVSRIIGGKPTSTSEFPWQVLASTDLGRCGASILSTTWILSAAHCFADGDPDRYSENYVVTVKRITIVAGLTKRSQENSDPDVQISIINEDEIGDHLFVHPDYKKGAIFNNDIALIKLKNPLTFGEKVKPIKLADTTDFTPGKEAITSGWGDTYNDDSRGPDILQYVDGLTLISKEDCKAVYGRFVTDKNICHKTESKNTCKGDSGGPVITGIGSSNGPPYVQIGITSFGWGGSGGCEAHQPAAFTDVAILRPWIDSISGGPQGYFGLPKPKEGCPSQTSEWIEGARYHDTEDSNNINSWSNPIDLWPGLGHNIWLNFCLKKNSRGAPWPAGNYCIHKYKNDCPQGFFEGHIYWDDEDSRNNNKQGGTLPAGHYDRNTQYYYCCRSDGNSPIHLPFGSPFFLYPYTSGCQEVIGMKSRMEYVFWDNEDDNNSGHRGGCHPKVEGEANYKLYYCYYYY